MIVMAVDEDFSGSTDGMDLRDLSTGADNVQSSVGLDGGPSPVFDLGEPYLRRWLYQIVLREASRPEDLTGYLDRDTLIAVWPELRVPKGVRQAWEEHHPQLRAAANACCRPCSVSP